jgi:hypothetical protein
VSEASEAADEDDGEGEGTESEDEEDPATETTSPERPSLLKKLETPNPELADDANNMEVDIVPIAPATVVAASSIMAGNTVIESPSPPLPHPAHDHPLLPQPRSKRPNALPPPERMPPTPPFPQKTPMHPQTKKKVTPNSKQICNPLIALKPLMCWPPSNSSSLYCGRNCTWRRWKPSLGRRLLLLTVRALTRCMRSLSSNHFPNYPHHRHPPRTYPSRRELSKRRDKRLELASRRRTYEVNDATKRKRAAENAVWSWWKVLLCLNALDSSPLTPPAVRARRTSS